jgi:hypothetical protein
MTDTHAAEPRSLLLFLFDKKLEARAHFALPMSIAAPAVNRILREALPAKLATVKEPWYRLVPHGANPERPFQRTPIPVGETSLRGERYFPEREPPPRVAPHPKPLLESFTVLIWDFQEELFRGRFSVDDLFHAGAEFLARTLLEKGTLSADDAPFYYFMGVSQEYVDAIQRDLLPDEAYRVEGVFPLPKREADRQRTTFTKVASAPLPVFRRSDFGAAEWKGRGKKGKGTVLMRPHVYRALLEMNLSDTVENGGYLMGQAYRTPRSPTDEADPKFKWAIEITDVLPAAGAHGTPVLLLFNGDTWSQMRRAVARDYPDKKLVSWFHTHLFAATDEFGLSGLDVDLHRQFYSRPWQVAILINIDGQGNREVRCFQKGPGSDLVECKFEVLKEQE